MSSRLSPARWVSDTSKADPWCVRATTRTPSYNDRAYLTTPEADPQTPVTPTESEPSAQEPGSGLNPLGHSPVPAAPSAESEPSDLTEPDEAPLAPATSEVTRPIATVRAAAPTERDLVYVPLAVNIGDGFKFGCGFFLAMVLAMLVGFVVLAALFVITGLFGLNIPLAR